MNFKKNFEGIYKKFIQRSLKKSLIYSTIISCFVLFILSFFNWFYNFKQFWIALIIFGGLEIILFSIFFKIFYPNDKKISRELDSYGLEERVITMHDYQNDDSLMARIQRENAKEKLNKFDNKLIKLTLPTFVVILLFVSIIFGAGLTTVSALASKGVIKTGQEIIGEVIPVIINQYEVSYEVDGEGEILGDMFQVVQEGESTTEVEALAMDGWVFVGWSDNFDEIIRQELDVHQNLSFTAIFQELDETDQGEDGGDGNEEGEPSDEEREGEPRGDNTSDQEEKNGDPSEEPGSGEGGKYESQNQVIDGQTYYGESTYDAAYESAMDSLQQDSGMSDGEKSIIGEYFSTIEK